jgi:phosphatidylinositol alpha-1,6-mannosyltransferase
MGSLALIIARLCRAKLVSQLHGTEIWKSISSQHLVPLERSDLVLCVSRDTKAKYELQARDARNAAVVANTVGAAFTPGSRASARARFGLTDEFTLLTVARLDTREGYKGQDRVIAALPHLIGPGGRKITYLVAGIGDDRSRLERLAAECCVAERVGFLGKVPFDALPDLYRAADLFVLPSIGEGFGIVFLEAMACGTPAIGVEAGGAPDALGDGELGLLLNPHTDITAALQSAIDITQPGGEVLSATVHKRFGARSFQRRVAQALSMLH